MNIKKEMLLVGALTIFSLLLSNCAETDYLDSNKDVSIKASFTKGDNTGDNTFLENSSNFYSFAYNDDAVYTYKKSNSLSDVEKIDLKDANTYNISMFANLSDDAFTAPDCTVPRGAFTLKDNVDIPDVCFGKCSYVFSTADNKQPAINLSYATCHLTVAAEAVSGDMKSASVTVMNMYNTLRIDGSFSGSSKRTFALKQSDTDANHFESTFVILPTNGTAVLNLNFTDNKGNVTTYKQYLNEELDAGQQLAVNFNQKTVTATVQLNPWGTLPKETYDVGTSYASNSIVLSNMPGFSATKANVYIDKLGTYCTGSVSTDANNKTTLSVSLPSNCAKIYAITFFDAQGQNFTAYLGDAGMGGASIANSTIAIPASPSVGDYFQYGYVFSQETASDWQKYHIKVGVSFNPGQYLAMSYVPTALAGYDNDGYSAWRLPTQAELTAVINNYFNDYDKYMADMHRCPLPGTDGIWEKYFWTSDMATDGKYYVIKPNQTAPSVSSSLPTDKNYLYIVRDL